MASTEQKKQLLKAKIALALHDELGRVPKSEDWLFRSKHSASVYAVFPPSPNESAFNSRASQSTKRQ
jgi:hypothetical protein